jgi:hypothetical protein
MAIQDNCTMNIGNLTKRGGGGMGGGAAGAEGQ